MNTDFYHIRYEISTFAPTKLIIWNKRKCREEVNGARELYV